MSTLLIVGGLALGLFLLAYLRSGRFGVTILAMGVGYLLTFLWGNILINYQIIIGPYALGYGIMYGTIVLLPAVLGLLFSHKQKSFLPGSIAALIIALLGVVLLLPVLGSVPALNDVFKILEENRDLIITGLLVLGLLDVVFARLPKASKHGHD